MKIVNFDVENYPREALEKLSRVGTLVYGPGSYWKEPSEDAWIELSRIVENAEVLIVRMNHRIDRDLINAAPRLQIVASATTGLNHIDEAALRERNIKLISLKGERDFLMEIRSTPELTFGLMLALLRNIPAAFEDVKNGHWNNNAFQGRELYGKTLGIVGFGRVGTIAARIAKGFGMHVVAVDPYVDVLRFTEENVTQATLPEVLEQSDIVSIHAAFTPETKNMIGQAEFLRMKPGAYFINTARGEIVAEVALLEALEKGQIAGAALDVLANEHRFFGDVLKGHPFVGYAKTHPNLLIVPHIGGMARESVEKTSAFIADKVIAALKM
ncbi:MAG: hydroxyacid dehydrogenase [Patescibacteria group bacterium]